MKQSILIIISIIALLLSCDTTDPKPPEEKPSGYQGDIPWPSLADTPWPMHHHDPQSTGRSKYAGPESGIITSRANLGICVSGISIGYDNTFYIGIYGYPFTFYSIGIDELIKWKTNISSYTTPLISSDSTIYVAGDENFFALRHNGDTLWRSEISKTVSVGINTDMEGNLYFIDYNHTLNVLDKNGNLIWTLHDNRFLHYTDAAPTFSPDGKVLYIQGLEVSVLAVDINSKSILWAFGDRLLSSSPVIDNSGNLYFVPGDDNSEIKRLFCINSSGEIIWEYEFKSRQLFDNTEPTIDYNGNIYFATDTLYSISYEGKLNWKVNLASSTIAPLICDVNNVVYVGTQDMASGENNVFAVTADGNIKWVVKENEVRILGVSPAISPNGEIYYPSWNDNNSTYIIIK